MKAMILAAGLGTRLRPLTNTRPKALVEVAGRTLLEITIARLAAAGVSEIIVNVHHFAEMVVDYLKANDDFGMRIEVSNEDGALLDTGGGLKKAAWFFLDESSDLDEPFILHNVDVISSIDLGCMVQSHRESKALATLAVKDRETSRYLLFDPELRLCGRRNGRDQPLEFVGAPKPSQALAFSGIHVISPRLLTMLTEVGAFPIIGAYLRLASLGERILGFRADEYSWRDLGTPENFKQAEQELERSPRP